MRFEEAYEGWTEKRLTQEEAASLLGVCGRTFRRYLSRFEKDGLEALEDRRLTQVSHLRAPVDELMALTLLYRERYFGWNVKHFFNFYKNKHGGKRSYTWVKNELQRTGLVRKAPKLGAHQKKEKEVQ
jgi:transposase